MWRRRMTTARGSGVVPEASSAFGINLRVCNPVYYILRITSNVGNRDSVLYWYLYCGGSNPPVLSFLTGCDRPLGGSPWPIIELRS